MRCKLHMMRTAPQAELRFTTTLASGLSIRWYPSFQMCSSWRKLSEELANLHARRIMVTHMNPSMLERIEEVRARGVLVASDGMVLDV